ncbi:MAG: KH domain-containing protein [Nanoarchaeota archaeon]|nr:KH domain-containing protein [Nanoarchaeota archaeon]
MLSYEIKIPEERVAVLVGTNGKTKVKIETETGTKLNISKDGDVDITGADALKLYSTREIIRAIGRGFNPNVALELLKTDYVLEIISLKDIAGKSQKTMERMKGRIIGRAGKSRAKIEEATNTYLSVYGKTVSIIGDVEGVGLCHQAVEMLLRGSMHKTVFTFLDKKKKEVMFGQEIPQ